MFWNLLKKELKEQLTLSSIIIVASLSLMYALIGQSIGNIESEISKRPLIGIVNLDKGELGTFIVDILRRISVILYEGENVEEGIIKTNNEGVALLIIPESFTYQINNGFQPEIKIFWFLRGLGIMDSVSSGVVENLMNHIKSEISKALLVKMGTKNPDFILNPVLKSDTTFFKGKKLVGFSPNQLMSKISSQSTITTVIIMMLILMAGGSVISSMGLEKENKTLETLLTMPVKRTQIVFSKILSSAISGLIMAAIYMIGFSFYMKSFTIDSSNLIDIGLGFYDYFLIGILLFTALLSGISISMLLGIFSRDFKSAQNMNFPLIALAVFSMVITMFKDFNTLPLALKIITFLIPFTHPMLAIRNLMVGDQSMIPWSITYTTFFVVLMVVIISKLFNSDRIIISKTKTRRIPRRGNHGKS